MRVSVREVQPAAFDGAASAPAPEYEAHLEQYRAYLSGARWEPVPGLFPVARGKTHAEAVKQAGKAGIVKVVGLGLPSENKAYLKDGVTQSVILWRVADLGYLTIQAAHAVGTGALDVGSKSIHAGKLGEIKIDGTSIILGTPFVFTKDNVDQFDF
jgi:ABC-type sugar transport system substrate-binding protein